MYLTIGLWLVAATTHVAHSLHVQKAFHPILLEADSRASNMMNDVRFAQLWNRFTKLLSR
jgi:hypothetical protein